MSRRYGIQSGSLQTYFLKQITEAMYFDPPLDPHEVNHSVVQQMPSRIREALITVDYASSATILGALSQLDAVAEDRKRMRKQNSPVGGNHGVYYTSNNQNQGVRNSNLSPGSNGNNARRVGNNSVLITITDLRRYNQRARPCTRTVPNGY